MSEWIQQQQGESKSHDFIPVLGVRQTRDQTPALPFISCVALAKLHPSLETLVFPSVKWAW